MLDLPRVDHYREREAAGDSHNRVEALRYVTGGDGARNRSRSQRQLFCPLLLPDLVDD